MRKKHKKRISTFFLCVLCLGVAFFFGNYLKRFREQMVTVDIPTTGTLNYRLSNVTGTATMEFSEELELTIFNNSPTVLGKEGLDEIVIDGNGVGVINAQHGKRGVVQAPNGGTIVFKNLTLNDKTDNSLGAWQNYLHFGGNVKFENVTITDSIYLVENTSATFVNCSFYSSEKQQYSVWIGNGITTFEGCTFEGYRGMKIHEFVEYTQDVKRVTIADCTFQCLKEKVGIAIGSVDLNTVVCVRDSVFNQNTHWDSVGSLVGVDSFYESDTFLENFTFIETGNTVIYDALYDESIWTKFY